MTPERAAAAATKRATVVDMAGRISEERDGMGDVAVLCPHIPPCDLFALRTPPLGIADGPMLGDVRGRQNGLMRATRKSREPMSGSASTLSPAIHPTMTRRRVAQCRDPTSTPSDSSCSSTAARPADRLPSAMNISRRRIVLASWTPRELETYAAYSQSVVLCSPRQPFSSLTQPRASWPRRVAVHSMPCYVPLHVALARLLDRLPLAIADAP